MSQIWMHAARKLVQLGYLPVPIREGSKRPLMDEWQKYRYTDGDFEKHRGGVGLLCGAVVGADEDIRDKTVVERIDAIVVRVLGDAPMRIGQPPKRLRVYRAAKPFAKVLVGKCDWVLPGDDPTAEGYKGHRVEFLAQGQQFVAYAMHPDTGQPYAWSGGDPLTVAAASLPTVTLEQVLECEAAIIAEFKALGVRPMGKLSALDAQRERTPNEVLQAGDPEVCRAALKHIPNDDLPREDWVRMGYAIAGALGADGLADFHEWSARAKGKYNAKQTETEWKSFLKANRSGMGTIDYLARQHGWQPPTRAKQPPPWGVPEDIFKMVDAAPMPLHVVPPIVLNRAQNLADITGCRVEHAVMYAIAAASIACGTRYRYDDPDNEWKQPLSLYGAVVDVSGGGKSIAARIADPLDDIQARLEARYYAAMTAWKIACKKATEDKTEQPPKPEIPWVKTSDFTCEGAARSMRNNPQGGGAIRDEIGGTLRGLNQYKGGNGNDDESLKEFYDGGASISLRKSAENSNSVRSVHLTLFGGIQPDLLDGVLFTDGNVASGTAARFCFSCYHPVQAVVKKADAKRDAIAATMWRDFLFALRDKKYPHWRDMLQQGIDPADVLLRLDEAAARAFDDWQIPFAAVVTDTPAPLGPVWSKYRGLALRLAGLWHLLKCRLEQVGLDEAGYPLATLHVTADISKETMAQVLEFIRYLQAHSYRMYGASDMESGAVAARALARIFLEEPDLVQTTIRDIIKRQRSGLAKNETVRAGLDYLAARGWTRTDKVQPRGGGRPSWTVFINPAIHAGEFGTGQNSDGHRQNSDELDDEDTAEGSA